MTTRTCSRPTCERASVVSLQFDYSARQVWLAMLSVEVDPNVLVLCDHHANRFTAPVGWDLAPVSARL